jgi:DNA polymerase III alpha subunit
MDKFKYNCGCCFDILEKKDNVPKILFDLRIENIDLECSRTWDLLSDGNTKGCFQLESRLGQTLAKRLKPENIEQLAALISIMRPGCLEAVRNNKSVTNHYIDKKNGEESIDYFHPSLEPILNKTYGEMIYQEQAMQIAQKVAGFDLKEADMLRKAIGKKKPEEMAKLKITFMDGAKKFGVVQESEAEELFGWIEKSQRYSFNKSHAVSYAFNAYLSAYAKAHFPKIFFASYLKYAKDKIDPQKEIKELVANALESDIFIRTPDLRLMNKSFIIHKGDIYFGLTDIKGFGESVYDKLKAITEKVDISSLNFLEILIHVLLDINSAAAKALIESGAMSFTGLSRKYILHSYNIFSKLSDREINWAKNNLELSNFKKVDEFWQFVFSMPSGKHGFFATAKRMQSLTEEYSFFTKPPFSLDDSIEWLADAEHRLLGISITCSRVDGCDTLSANTTCKELKTTLNKKILIACEIDDLNIVKTKKGKNPGQIMCFIKISDSTGYNDGVVCFPEQYGEFESFLMKGNTVLIEGSKGKAQDSGLIVKKIWQL